MSKTLASDPIGTIFGEHPNERAAEPYIHSYGITKREYFAALALQGILASDDYSINMTPAEEAVDHADQLIEELNRD